MCSDSESSCAGREEGGLQTSWLGCCTAGLELEIVEPCVFSDAVTHPQTCWPVLHLGSRGQSFLGSGVTERCHHDPLLRTGLSSEPCPWESLGPHFSHPHTRLFPPNLAPRGGGQSCHPDIPNSRVAWECGPQTNRQRGRDINLAPKEAASARWVVLGVSLTTLHVSFPSQACHVCLSEELQRVCDCCLACSVNMASLSGT